MAKRQDIQFQQLEAPESEIVTVTPEMAREWLRTNEGNRDLKQLKIGEYAGIMESGKWQQAHPDHILFNTKGRLINGQHRLHAQVRANVTITYRVLRNQPERTAHTIDQPSVRTTRDSFTISEGQSISAKEASMLARFIAGLYVTSSSQIPYFREDLIVVFHKYRTEIAEIAGWFNRDVKGLSRMPVRAAVLRAYIARPQQRDRIREFVNVLYSGQYAKFEEDAAAIALRDYLLSQTRRGPRDIDAYAKTELALINFIDRKSLRRAVPARREMFIIAEDELLQ